MTIGPSFLLKLINDDDLTLTFTFVIRQTSSAQSSTSSIPDTNAVPTDTNIHGLTFVYASTPREVENLVTREFHADPNLHKNANVQLVGDFSTGGTSSVSFEWTWRWKPPKPTEDKGEGWRNSCSVCTPISLLLFRSTDGLGEVVILTRKQFVEYDQRAHRLDTLASFSFWVSSRHPPRPCFFVHVTGSNETRSVISQPP